MRQTTKKERFFATSLKLIHQKGFKATTMRDIAHELNFEVANIYNYINSKDSLLEHFIFEVSAEFHEALDNILDTSLSPEEKLRSVVASQIQLASKKPYELALLTNEWRNLKEPKKSRFLEERQAYEHKVSNIIQAGIDSGQFRPLNLEIITYTVTASLRWLHDNYANRETSLNPFEIEKQITDFILGGLTKKG